MKELSIEQKAKRYDEAIKVAEKIHKFSSDPAEIKRMEQIFPELAESEDDKIRKDIIILVKDWWDRVAKNNISTKEQMLAWLEKQDEHKKFRDSIQIGDKVTRNEDGVLVNLSQLKRVAKKDEKQGEQKPEWSKEDEELRLACIRNLEQQSPLPTSIYTECIKWLKFRLPQKPCTPTEEELSIAKKDAFNEALDKTGYSNGEPTFDDGWSAAVSFFREYNLKPL